MTTVNLQNNKLDSLLCTYLPLIWQILWRTGLGLMMLTAIALFIEGLKSEKK
ncbi:hypothetical protein [Pseudanabaena sp. UWO310]|uniref:hypothetical protein n=1 Tax=Pseudanabaena sp. UWO310 TaxID=2480795 RepID=UPI00168042C1|nr:hypothetical protein [Pseudanabaena sp. UWO310]